MAVNVFYKDTHFQLRGYNLCEFYNTILAVINQLFIILWYDFSKFLMLFLFFVVYLCGFLL